MVMTDEKAKGLALDDFFAAARSDLPEPSGVFLARVLEDAEAVQAGFAAVPTAPPRAGLFARFADLVGGWPALGGMVTATLAGAWIGFVGVDRIDTISGAYFASAETLGTVNLLPDGDLLALAAE